MSDIAGECSYDDVVDPADGHRTPTTTCRREHPHTHLNWLGGEPPHCASNTASAQLAVWLPTSHVHANNTTTATPNPTLIFSTTAIPSVSAGHTPTTLTAARTKVLTQAHASTSPAAGLPTPSAVPRRSRPCPPAPGARKPLPHNHSGSPHNLVLP